MFYPPQNEYFRESNTKQRTSIRLNAVLIENDPSMLIGSEDPCMAVPRIIMEIEAPSH